MKRALAEYSPKDTLAWFEKRGVSFVKEEDGRYFPASQDAMQIVHALESSLDGVRIDCGCSIASLPETDVAVICTGGGSGLDLLKNLPVETIPPVPSLFSFNLSDGPGGGRNPLSDLMGLSVEASLGIPGSKFRSNGTLLITDWGLSGPAALKLSSYAARHLASLNYNSPLQIRWLPFAESKIHALLEGIRSANPRKLAKSCHPDGISSRLWDYLLSRSGIATERCWAELGRKGLNRLTQVLVCDTYHIHGKTRFRDEFVTCGGVSLSSVDLKTLESKQRPGLYFAGEILDVDAVTGGFNLQAAWSTAHLAAKSIINKYGTQII